MAFELQNFETNWNESNFGTLLVEQVYQIIAGSKSVHESINEAANSQIAFIQEQFGSLSIFDSDYVCAEPEPQAEGTPPASAGESGSEQAVPQSGPGTEKIEGQQLPRLELPEREEVRCLEFGGGGQQYNPPGKDYWENPKGEEDTGYRVRKVGDYTVTQVEDANHTVRTFHYDATGRIDSVNVSSPNGQTRSFENANGSTPPTHFRIKNSDGSYEQDPLTGKDLIVHGLLVDEHGNFTYITPNGTKVTEKADGSIVERGDPQRDPSGERVTAVKMMNKDGTWTEFNFKYDGADPRPSEVELHDNTGVWTMTIQGNSPVSKNLWRVIHNGAEVQPTWSPARLTGMPLNSASLTQMEVDPETGSITMSDGLGHQMTVNTDGTIDGQNLTQQYHMRKSERGGAPNPSFG